VRPTIVEAAAAVIQRADGSFLLGRRPPGKVYAGWWEFPGGKLEAGETAREALVRELAEELGIVVDTAYPWMTREHVYEHAHVRLHFFRVPAWSGELRNLHHDALSWQRCESVTVAPLLPANAPVLAALKLPEVYGITYAGKIGADVQLAALTRALAGGLRLVQLREPDLPVAHRAAFIHAAVDLCRKLDARVLINADMDLARAAGADGVHMPARQLMSVSQRPDFPLVAASCHNAEELSRAVDLALDFVVLGPVKETASHPGAACVGWQGFTDLIARFPLPVYAVGGLQRRDMDSAWLAGAHGIAAIRSVWEPA
jgi:8-oxo-dGTP diphosphatase